MPEVIVIDPVEVVAAAESARLASLLSLIARSRGDHEGAECRAQCCDACDALAELDDIADELNTEHPKG